MVRATECTMHVPMHMTLPEGGCDIEDTGVQGFKEQIKVIKDKIEVAKVGLIPRARNDTYINNESII